VQLSPQSFEAVTAMFHRVAGIRLTPDKHSLVVGRLNRLAMESGAANLDEYVADLLRVQDREELTRVVDRLTTNETYFFREPKHFEVLDELAKAHDRRRKFRVWSAASSSGEEAYSAAMVLADVLGPNGWEIVGTDLSSAMVETAQVGLYSMDRTSGIGQRRLQKYCRKGQGPYEGKLLIARELKEYVRFEQANLMRPLPPLGQFDVIFLRNVLIYFDTESKREIVERCAVNLVPGGLLFTGHAETLNGVTWKLAAVQPAVYECAG
jgi:chemotaxis protein methyltransferase CheR